MRNVVMRSDKTPLGRRAAAVERLENRALLSASLAYGPAPFAPNAVIPAVNYDKGGEGVAYHDTTLANRGGDRYRAPDAVDIQSGGPVGHFIGYAVSGEWLMYTLNIPAAGHPTPAI